MNTSSHQVIEIHPWEYQPGVGIAWQSDNSYSI